MSTSLQAVLRTIQTRLESISDAPAREAEWLVEHITGLNRSKQLVSLDSDLAANQLEKIDELLARRGAGEPLAYVLGEQHFWTLRLKVSPAVLVPRPETELVVERALLHLPEDQAAQVLDLGTGSGAIALAVAQERPHARVLAVDQSAPALAVAQENAAGLRLDNVAFLHSDWFTAVPPRRFDLILSNPPYIAAGDPHLESAVLAYEPSVALISGTDGLAAIRQIIGQARDFLTPGGWLILEHGWQQASAVRQLLESSGLSSVASHADLAGHERVTEAQAPSPSSF
jgi:release factor glutamine methyltransferase